MEPTSSPYASVHEWLLDQRRFLSLALHRHLLRLRSRGALNRDPAAVLARLKDEDLSRFFSKLAGPPLGLGSMEGAMMVLRERIEKRLQHTPHNLLPSLSLSQRLNLKTRDTRILHALSAALYDPRIHDLLHTLAGSRWRPWPRGGDLAELLALTGAERADLLRALDPQSPLVQYLILEEGPTPDGWTQGASLPPEERCFLLSKRARDFLTTHDTHLDERLQHVAKLQSGSGTLHKLHLPEATRELLADLLPEDREAEFAQSPALWLQGPPGSGAKALAAAIANEEDASMLVVQMENWLQNPPDLRLLLREAVLENAAILLDMTTYEDGDLLAPQTSQAARMLLRGCIDATRARKLPFFVWTRRPLKMLSLHFGELEIITCTYPNEARRLDLWKHHLEREQVALARNANLQRLADAFVLSEQDIARISRQARRAQQENPRRMAAAALEEICRDDMDLRLQGLTSRIKRPWGLEDIVLTDQQTRSLREIIDYATHRKTLFQDWGFGVHYATGRGVNCLLTGPPGTGKTMAASVIANALDLPVYRIELSQVVDRYVGETEKHLQRIFDEASRCPCLLLFDEADSLFGKRTEVRSSNDRYANLEVNYLLQRMEDFDGVTVLTTNLETSLDQAFLRRIRFSVSFPEPDESLSLSLWEELLPDEAPISDDIDFVDLARTFTMTGGHIKNAIMRAALEAMREKRSIHHGDLYNAAVLEYNKLGKLVAR